jgi:hypothetical protein
LASACDSGVAAAMWEAASGEVEFGVAAAECMRMDPPTPEIRKRKLRVIARIDVLLNVFLIRFMITFVDCVNTFDMHHP